MSPREQEEVGAGALADLGMRGLERRFEALNPPEPDQPVGALSGRIVAAVALDPLPAPLRRAALDLVAGLSPWRGKHFGAGRGSNRWGPLDLRRVHFRTALDERAGALVMDYDIDENPSIFKGMRGDLRCLGPGLYLGRMSWAGAAVLFFTLEA